MRGYIREYRPGKYSYTLDVGKVEGKRKKVEKGGFTSKKAAEDALAIKLAELATTGEIFTPSEKTLEQLYNEFILSASITRKPATVVKYKSIWIHHIEPALGYRYIKTIKSTDIDAFIASKAAAGYSEQFVKSMFKCLSGIFLYAIDKEYIKISPMTKASVPKVVKAPVEIFTLEEIATLKNRLTSTNLLIPFLIGLYTGMRLGEVVGLRWRDIDLTHGTISINHQLLAEKGRYAIGETKTPSSVRKIKINDYLIEALRQEKKTQVANKKLAAEFWRTNRVYNYFTKRVEDITDFVCIKDNGAFITHGTVKYIDRVAKPLGINFYFHKLRHTHATMLLENGASIKMVQERLGHARPDITLNIYSHVTNKHEAEILDILPAI